MPTAVPNDPTRYPRKVISLRDLARARLGWRRGKVRDRAPGGSVTTTGRSGGCPRQRRRACGSAGTLSRDCGSTPDHGAPPSTPWSASTGAALREPMAGLPGSRPPGARRPIRYRGAGHHQTRDACPQAEDHVDAPREERDRAQVGVQPARPVGRRLGQGPGATLARGPGCGDTEDDHREVDHGQVTALRRVQASARYPRRGGRGVGSPHGRCAGGRHRGWRTFPPSGSHRPGPGRIGRPGTSRAASPTALAVAGRRAGYGLGRWRGGGCRTGPSPARAGRRCRSGRSQRRVCPAGRRVLTDPSHGHTGRRCPLPPQTPGSRVSAAGVSVDIGRGQRSSPPLWSRGRREQ